MGQFTQGGGGADDANFLLGTVPAGAALTKVAVQGQISAESAAVTGGTGGFLFQNLMTGIQWVVSGDTPASITVGSSVPGSWLKFSEGAPPNIGYFYLQQTIGYDLYICYPVFERWHGLFYTPEALDIYWSYGENTDLGDLFPSRASGSWNIEWATYP